MGSTVKTAIRLSDLSLETSVCYVASSEDIHLPNHALFLNGDMVDRKSIMSSYLSLSSNYYMTFNKFTCKAKNAGQTKRTSAWETTLYGKYILIYVTWHVSNQMFIIREVNSDIPSKYKQNKYWKKSDA